MNILLRHLANIPPSIGKKDGNGKKEAKRTPPTGLEPAIFGLGGRRVIHYATEADVDIVYELKSTALGNYWNPDRFRRAVFFLVINCRLLIGFLRCLLFS